MKTGLLQFPAQIMSILTKVDCLKVVVETSGPLPSEMSQILLDYQQEGCNGWFTFNRNAIEPEDIIDLPDLPRTEKGQKTASQRLRNVIYLLWKKDNHNYEDSNLYYEFMMNKLIEHYKEKLD